MNDVVQLINVLEDAWWLLVTQQFLQTTIVASLVLFVVAFRKRIPSQWRYLLLLVAIAKFVVPPVATSLPTGLLQRTPLISLQYPENTSVPMEAPAVAMVDPRSVLGARPEQFTALAGPKTNELISRAEAQATLGDSQYETTSSRETQEGMEETEPSMPRLAPMSGMLAPTISWRGWLMVVHLVGGLLLIGAAISQTWWLHRKRGEFSSSLTDISTDLAKKQSFSRRPCVFESERITSPISFGVIWPTIVVPKSMTRELDSKQTQLVLLHELTHHHRYDPLMMSCQLVVLAAWWFHPMVWLLNRAIQTVREECCDDFLIVRSAARGDFYCETLLQVAKSAKPRRLTPAVSMADGDRRRLASRMRRLMDASLPRAERVGLLGCVLAIAAAVTLLPGIPSSVGRERVARETGSEAGTEAAFRTISGQMRDAKDNAVSNVRVFLAESDPWEANIDGPEVLARTRTGADGSYSFQLAESLIEERTNPHSNFFVFAIRSGYCLNGVEFKLGESKNTVNLKLISGDAAKIHLRGTGDRAPEGTATIAYFRVGGSGGPWLSLPKELRNLVSVPLAREFSTPWVRPGSLFGVKVVERYLGVQTARPSEPAPSPWRITLREVGRVDGRIVLPPDKKIDPTKINIRVATSTKWQHGEGYQAGTASTVPDASGRFAIDRVASGTMRVFISEPADSRFQCIGSWNEVVTAGETTQLEIPMERAVKVTRQFLDKQTNEPVSGVRMYMSLPRGSDMIVTSDLDGVATAWLRPNQSYHTVYVVPKGYLRISREAPIKVSTAGGRRSESHQLEPIRLTRSRVVRGRVLDADGNPQPKLTIAMAWDDPGNRRQFFAKPPFDGVYSLIPAIERSTKTNEDGEYVFDDVSPTASLELTPIRGGVRFGESHIIQPGEEEREVELRTTVKDLVSLRGKVVDERGAPVPQIPVQVVVMDQATNRWVMGKSVTTDIDGEFSTERSFPRDNQYRFFVGNNGHKNAVQSEVFHPAQAETTTAPTIRITQQAIRKPSVEVVDAQASAIEVHPATTNLAGRVVDSKGSPVQAKLTLWHNAQTMRRRTNADGSFSFSDLGGKVAWLFVDAKGFQFDGRYVKLDHRLQTITLYRDQEKHPNPMRTRNATVSRQVRDLALAKVAAFHDRLMNSSNPARNKRKAIIALSLLDPQRGLAAIDKLGDEASWTYGEFVRTHQKRRPEIAAQAANQIVDPRGRQFSLVDAAKYVPAETRRRLLEEALEANKQCGPEGKVEGLANIAEALLQNGHRERAEELFGQATELALALPESDRTSFTHSFLACKLAQVDLRTAQALMLHLPPPGDSRRSKLESGNAKSRMATRCITIDPNYAEDLISQIVDERIREDAALKASYAVAAIDYRRALELTKQIASDRCKRALAMGYITGNSDMPLSEKMKTMEQAFEILEDSHQNRSSGTSIYKPMQVGIFLLPIIEKELPEQLHEYFWKTLSMRGDFTTGRIMQRLGERHNGILRLADPVVGAYLSPYSAEIAESLTTTPGDESIDLEYGAAPTFMLGAMTTYAPEKAIRFASMLPETTDGEIEMKRAAWVEVLQMIGRTPDERRQYLNDSQYHLWHPGQEF